MESGLAIVLSTLSDPSSFPAKRNSGSSKNGRRHAKSSELKEEVGAANQFARTYYGFKDLPSASRAEEANGALA